MIRTALTLAACFALANCGNGGSPASPSAPAPPPPPPPPKALSWLDVPEEAVSVEVAAIEEVPLRISAAVAATYTVSASNGNIGASLEVVRDGVVRVRIEGRDVGESEVMLRAEAEGYETAESSFRVEVEPIVLFGWITSESTLGCLEWDHYENFVRLLDAPTDTAVDWIVDRVEARECGFFDSGDPIEWTGSGERVPLGEIALTGIHVWGRPYVGGEQARAPRNQWWVPKAFTSFVLSTTAAGERITAAAVRARAELRH